ncbi:hypothetical protein ACNKU7_11345 [Microbulbifer sp. SA54]|uniref:hypothetical protein n=1 Tax=Microbulbifer sp. SA54 TaxID=3401577 RepID=UPI003AB0E710
MSRFRLLLLAFFLLSSCATATDKQKELYEFAQANCLFWYFDEKGYDTKDIRAITGGMVEKSDLPAEKFQAVSIFIKDYSPALASKNNIDPHLLRCFSLSNSAELRALIAN